MNPFHKKLWQVTHSGRLHIPILSACSAYKWACGVIGIEEDMDWCLEQVRVAVNDSSHIDKDGVYSTDAYLYGQYESAEIAITGGF